MSLMTDMIILVYDQLPRTLQDKVSIDLKTDAYHINTIAVFKDKRGRTWECPLETRALEGVPVSCTIPELFLAQLCVEL